MNTQLPYYNFFPDTFLAQTMRFSLDAVGAHAKLTASSWIDKDCSIPSDNKKIAQILGIPLKKWLKISGEVLSLWERLGSDKFIQPKLLKQRENLSRLSQTRQSAANQRWSKEKSSNVVDNANGHANQMQTESICNASNSISSSSQNNNKNNGFDEFWEIYPRRGDKLMTEFAWNAAIIQETPERIMAATRKYIQVTDSKYLLNSDKFLSNEKWRDYLDEPEIVLPEWQEKIKQHSEDGYRCALFLKGCAFEHNGDSATIYCSSSLVKDRLENFYDATICQAHGLKSFTVIVEEERCCRS